MGRSEELFEQACRLLPGGVNSPVRAYRAVGMAPRFITRADGAYLWDEDGRRYIDYVCSWGPMILGHNHPVIREAVERAVRPDDIHMPRTGLVEMENALSNGRVMPLEKMKEVYEAAHRHGLPVHLDGARIFNAAAALGVEARAIAQYGDSVMFCLSKGLCAPVGSMVCGDADFIARARKNRKILGGGMRQCGILAAAGIIAIEKMSKRVKEDHENARYFAQKLEALPSVTVDMDAVQISMIFFTIDKPGFDHQAFPAAMREKGILINGLEDGKYRFVTHYWVGKKEIDRVADTLAQILA